MPVNQIQNGSSSSTTTPSARNGSKWPENVGIIAMDIYFPSSYVDQTDLEEFNGVSKGKYTIGLGQLKMGFTDDREDISSICLTVTESLLKKYKISPADIGFLMIGTETIIDKSKSIKTVLMDLFKDSGNTDIEGIHATNACYGGTASLFHAIDWIESSNWDGRYALVVAADIAVYASGAARPTGGCGAVAMLIGPNSAIILDRKVRSTYMANVYDFYKPDLSSEYPYVDGPLSNQCYLQALDQCFNLYFDKANRNREELLNHDHSEQSMIDLSHFDAVIFHAPYCKLVQKSVARMHLLNNLRLQANDPSRFDSKLEKYRNIKLEDSYNDREMEKLLLTLSSENFSKQTDPSLLLAREIGNMYTASLYACLISYLISDSVENQIDKHLLLFSYGSGLAASMFSARITKDKTILSRLSNGLADIKSRLQQRRRVPPAKFEETLNLREKTHNIAPYAPTGDISLLMAGTYYITEINQKYHRKYSKA
ncbi:hydroxymethylglutaryl-CoA synthase isoform X2 [Dermatophagoides pteronyssinus]|uniref:hydroxymethylglutaryl-CoA synthase isoform X2 n=1 Tax=Dermatophagoides pteronyssinus TaxID=6956 RepID=UPI003F669997